LSKCSFFCRTAEDTKRLGRLLGSLLPKGAVVVLEGDLGCGKTEFVRGLASALGISEEEVSSPSFNIVHEYETFVHVDLYRVGGDLESLGIEEIMEDDRVKAVEWGEPLKKEFRELVSIVVRCREVEGGRSFEVESYIDGLCERLEELYRGGN